MPTIPTRRRGTQCPHCRQHYYSEGPNLTPIGGDHEGGWAIEADKCPACHRVTIVALQHPIWSGEHPIPPRRFRIHPAGTSRPPLPPEVTAEFAADYLEACRVLPHSAKASAALSRFALQYLLEKKAGVKPNDLAKEIDELLASKTLPAHLHRIVDMIRGYGNFGTHPIPSAQTGAIIEVEAGEAECLLEILEALFDWYFVQPTIWDQRKAALDKKLTDAGKPPSKG